MRIHFVANTHRADALEAARTWTEWLLDRGIEVGIDAEAASAVPAAELVANAHFSEADLIVAFGGDGTVIRAAHLASARSVPVLGVYYGRFGFVTQAQGEELGAALSAFLDGEARFESRMMLRAELHRGGQGVVNVDALNEIVLQRSSMGRMLTFEVDIDGHPITRYPADGIIVSTPTGSTAYNLSTGGPIMDPKVNAMILSAIAPHTLSARSLVVAPDSEIRLKVESHGDCVLSADGHTRFHLIAHDEVSITRSPLVTRLVSVEHNDFLVKLGTKLLWSQALELGELDDE